MDLNAAAVIFMGGYVVVIVVAGLVMSMRPGGGTVPLLAGAGGAGAGSCRQAIQLGGDAEALGNFRGRVQSVVLNARTGRLEEVTLASGGGLLEGGRVPADAIVSAEGTVLQLAEPWTEPSWDGSQGMITLQRDAAVRAIDGKRLGKLRLVCFEGESHLIRGLVVAGGRRGSSQTVFLPIQRVRVAGPDRVVTDLRAEDWGALQVYAGDQAIRETVLERLAGDPATQPLVRSVTVDVQEQRVRLRGYVGTQAQAEAAARVARSVPGVLAVERGIYSDEDLAARVRDAITRELGPSVTSLDVRSEFGQVDIVGQVSDRQALRRIDAVAAQVAGVVVLHNLATVAKSA